MPNLTSSDLSDPQPPLPGERERALVATRAHELGRRRRLLQGGGALALVAAVAVSVAALTAGGASGPGGTNRVEAASGTDTSVSTPVSHVTTVPSTVAPTPDTTPTPATASAPEATPDTAPAVQEAPVAAPQEVAPVEPAAPTTFALSGTVTGNPADSTVTLTLSGDGGTFTVAVDSAGNYSVSGLPAGSYLAVGFWTATNDTGTASGATKFGAVNVTSDSTANFSF